MESHNVKLALYIQVVTCKSHIFRSKQTSMFYFGYDNLILLPQTTMNDFDVF